MLFAFFFRRRHFNLIPPSPPPPFCTPSLCFSPICCGWLWQAARGSAHRSSLSDGTESRRVVGLIRDRGTGKIVHQDAGLQRTPPAWLCNHCLKSVGELGPRLIKHLGFLWHGLLLSGYLTPSLVTTLEIDGFSNTCLLQVEEVWGTKAFWSGCSWTGEHCVTKKLNFFFKKSDLGSMHTNNKKKTRTQDFTWFSKSLHPRSAPTLNSHYELNTTMKNYHTTLTISDFSTWHFTPRLDTYNEKTI